MTRTTSSNEPPCPIWESSPSVQDISAVGHPYTSPRAGGRFWLMQSGAPLLQPNRLAPRQKANLSYWIYKHNLEYRLFDANPGLGEKPLVLDEKWVVDHRDRTPSAEDRMLTFLRELICSDDAGELNPDEDLLQAAGGCRDQNDLQEIRRYSIEQGWTGSRNSQDWTTPPYQINLGARLHVEERARELDLGRQGFVAMWFNPCMDEAYKLGIQPAIRDAGYEPRLINDRGFTGGVVNEILAEIRKSKFVVADFTSCDKCKACEQCKHIGARGGVYFEVGFALGLGKTVFLTCHEDRAEAVHFDINHLNRIEWETPEDLREQLKNSIEAVLGHSPLDPSDDQPTDSRQPESIAA